MSSIASRELFDAVVSGDLQAVEQGLRGRGVSPNGVWIDNIGKSRSLLYGAAQVRALLNDCSEIPCVANFCFLFLSILRLCLLSNCVVRIHRSCCAVDRARCKRQSSCKFWRDTSLDCCIGTLLFCILYFVVEKRICDCDCVCV